MRFNVAGTAALAAGLGVLSLLSACSTSTVKKPSSENPSATRPRELPTPTAMPTVPPPVSNEFPTPKPPPKVGKPGEQIGPEITFLGITRADGKPIEPSSVASNGVATFTNFVGSGFQLVIEAKPGISGVDVGRRVYAYSQDNPNMQPDLQIEVDKPLGDGSVAVCDRMRPNIGGVPAINPPSFSTSQKVSNTLNDLGCRFEVFLESDSACTLGKSEDWQFRDPQTKIQFCMTVAKAWNFPVGDTLVSVRLLDTAGNPGPVKQIRIDRPEVAPTQRPRPRPTPTVKTLPLRE